MGKLQTVTEYAIENGWLDGELKFKRQKVLSLDIDEEEPYHIFYENIGGTRRDTYYLNDMYSDKDIIFNHDFLKAVFGDELSVCVSCKFCEGGCLYDWQSHAQQMVISEDPIEYIYKLVKEQE